VVAADSPGERGEAAPDGVSLASLVANMRVDWERLARADAD
jgi:hypothetical protein